MEKKSWKKIAIIAAIALAAAAGIALLVIFVIVPAGKYSQADAMLKQEDYAGAYDEFDRLGEYRDAQARKDALQTQIMNTRTAERMTFGGYDWLVLEQRDGNALLLLDIALAPQPYHETLTEVTWETCSLRTYLNGAFYSSFSEEDRARIAETTVINRNNAEIGEKAGEDTKDHVFLLSLAEAKLYFAGDAARITRDPKGASAWWWLRSPGLETIAAVIVKSNGEIGYAGTGVNNATRNVRPAMWITMEQAAPAA